MKLIKCESGHFYDEERYTQCPYCNGQLGAGNQPTASAAKAAGEDAVTVDMNSVVRGTAPEKAPEDSLQSAVKAAAEGVAPVKTANDPQTISFFKQSMGVEPVVGWLVCIEGPCFGQDFRLKAGRNFIGRAPSMDVCIPEDSTVSREKHAVMVYEPKKNLFIVQSGDSKELSYLNDEVILAATEMHANDVILVGKTKLMLIPCCSATFNWDMVKPAQEEGKK